MSVSVPTASGMDHFELSSANHFDAIMESLNQEQPVAAIPDVVTQNSIYPKDLHRIYQELNFNELKNAALTLANKNSQFDLNWEYQIGQLNAGINQLLAQNVNADALFALLNMSSQLHADLQLIKTSVVYCMLHLVENKDKEEMEKKKKFDRAQLKAQNRANQKAIKTLIAQTIPPPPPPQSLPLPPPPKTKRPPRAKTEPKPKKIKI